MAKQFTLGKTERLKSRKQIDHLFKAGKSFTVFPFKIYYRLDSTSGDAELKFGVGAGTRNFKKAADRNRIKRLTREAWRLQNTVLKQKLNTVSKKLNVFFIYTGKELPDFTLVKDKVALALKKMIGLVDESPAADT